MARSWAELLGDAEGAPESDAARRGFGARLRDSLARSRRALAAQLAAAAFDPHDSASWERLEEALLGADVGAAATAELVARLEARPALADLGEALVEEVAALLGAPPRLELSARPSVILVVGVNGTGKTTTIGKLAQKLREHGRDVTLGAADTFRAAAEEQLEVWATRAGARFVGGERGSDPAAVAYDAVAAGGDVVVIDTAGRLHTQTNLMDELAKVKRVIAGKLPGAPHETLLVLDATTGQNGLQQARLFSDAVGVTGVALTKLDGSAKGGIAVAIAWQLGLPVKLVGVGEGLDDLRPFDAHEFARALVGGDSSRLGPRGLPAGAPSTLADVFDSLSERLGKALGDLRKRGTLDEDAISRALREIRLALLDADVNLDVVTGFVERVRARALGEQVLKSLTPGQQVVKVVHDELTELMGADAVELVLGRRAVILLAGLQGSGKTTAAAKLALQLAEQGRRPGLVAADLQRPAAADQLAQLGAQIGVPVFRSESSDPIEAARSGLERALAEGLDTVIVDTAGRLQVDEPLMDELERLAAAVTPSNSLLVLDAMTGQQAAEVAVAFQRRIAFDGVVLTKLDGDARGGAALSVKHVTGRPIMFISTGERLETLEVFHPERMASRILGMGDVLSLIERAEKAVSVDEQAAMEQRMRQGQFSFDDFLQAQKMLRRMGPLQGLLKLMPGMGELADVELDEGRLGRVEAIILSMTPRERGVPHLIDGHRRRRIAAGSGTSVQDVNQLLEARKMMETMMKQMGKGKMPSLPGLGDPRAASAPTPMSRRSGSARKKKNKRAGRR